MLKETQLTIYSSIQLMGTGPGLLLDNLEPRQHRIHFDHFFVDDLQRNGRAPGTSSGTTNNRISTGYLHGNTTPHALEKERPYTNPDNLLCGDRWSCLVSLSRCHVFLFLFFLVLRLEYSVKLYRTSGLESDIESFRAVV